MTRERKGRPPLPDQPRQRRRASTVAAETIQRVRRRAAAAVEEIALSEEELRALADEGIDPEEVQRLARERPEQPEASEHDRDTARDDLEGLIAEEDDYPA